MSVVIQTGTTLTLAPSLVRQNCGRSNDFVTIRPATRCIGRHNRPAQPALEADGPGYREVRPLDTSRWPNSGSVANRRAYKRAHKVISAVSRWDLTWRETICSFPRAAHSMNMGFATGHIEIFAAADGTSVDAWNHRRRLAKLVCKTFANVSSARRATARSRCFWKRTAKPRSCSFAGGRERVLSLPLPLVLMTWGGHDSGGRSSC